MKSEEKQYEDDPANLKDVPTHAVLRETSQKLGVAADNQLGSRNRAPTLPIVL